ncbi:hypothetical protein HBI39_211560 [Parastagonospora nodorum]|nr:hypothetical protein HBI79_101390 [Parastagonospora nodorum]KAH5317822.1 hypothetical protein HBI12_116510 [Parastagonospora nodorum]KAH6288986.1 hypothetical protein HBI39_211560 [Parastagonospora nodorum]
MMATRTVNHAAAIFADMSVDGPVIGTLVAIFDRAKNLPNRKSMGKQDPYCAARLGKEAKKTKTDKRGGQTPRWDQELRFTVHDSPDYHRLKISVFNDDKKTELIGETWANLDAVITPGGGQSDDWHPLNCKGKYAGEIRIELTFYDTRPKAEKPVVEKRRESTRPEGQSPAVGGPRESMPVKRRPLPSDPTGATPSPSNTPEQRGLRGLRAGPRELGSPRHAQPQERTPVQQRSSQQPDTPSRRPLPDASPLNGSPASNNTPQRQQVPQAQDPYTPPNPRPSLTNVTQQNGQSYDLSYAAPKPYEVQAANAVPSHVRDNAHNRTMSQDNYQSSRPQSQFYPPEPAHSHSAPVVPTQHTFEPEPRQDQYQQFKDPQYQQSPYSHEQYQDPQYQVAPLRPSRSHDRSPAQLSPLEQYHSDTYGNLPSPYDENASHRRRSAMQPMVEDEDDMPPPPPTHRKNASTLPHPSQENLRSYQDESPAPLNMTRYREEPQQAAYSPPDPYSFEEQVRQQPAERRMTYPRGAVQQQAHRPVSRGDAIAPSPLRQETSALPSSLIAGRDPSRDMVAYEAPPPSYEPQPRLRQYSEPAEYRSAAQYEAPAFSQELVHRSSLPPYDSPYYPHDPPEQPRRRSPVHDFPVVKPRATSPSVNPRYSPNPVENRMSRYEPSPAENRMSRYEPTPVENRMSRYSPTTVDDRTSRGPARSMPTRKSVSPRPPPMENSGERRLSGIAFNPDSFDVYNPRMSKSPIPSDDEERPGSRMEYNDKGQIVTFSGRVVDASDHLPIDNWAPEPTPKGTVKEKPARTRAQLNGSRDIEAARQREEKYRRDREARDRIRHATSQTFGDSDEPSNALVTTRHDFNDRYANAGALVLADQSATRSRANDRDGYQRRSPRPSYDGHDSGSYSARPEPHVLRERHNPNSYGSSPSYGNEAPRYSGAPPIPAKIPLGYGANIQNEDMALSLELQSIDIGPGSGGRRGRTQPRRQYGY